MTTTEYMGFKVEWTGNDAQPAIFYGKRGAVYGAIRHSGGDWCYIVGAHGIIRRIKGNGWVKISSGTTEITGAK